MRWVPSEKVLSQRSAAAGMDLGGAGVEYREALRIVLVVRGLDEVLQRSRVHRPPQHVQIQSPSSGVVNSTVEVCDTAAFPRVDVRVAQRGQEEKSTMIRSHSVSLSWACNSGLRDS